MVVLCAHAFRNSNTLMLIHPYQRRHSLIPKRCDWFALSAQFSKRVCNRNSCNDYFTFTPYIFYFIVRCAAHGISKREWWMCRCHGCKCSIFQKHLIIAHTFGNSQKWKKEKKKKKPIQDTMFNFITTIIRLWECFSLYRTEYKIYNNNSIMPTMTGNCLSIFGRYNKFCLTSI